MSRRASILSLSAALLAAGCSPNPNPLGVTDTGTIVGTLVDAKDHTTPIATALLQVGLQAIRLSANDNGGFRITNVPTGTQTLTITATGYQSLSLPVVVKKDQTSDLHYIGLASATGL